jgi:PilZ domain
VSRIWDALKAAQAFRARASLQKNGRHPGPQRRDQRTTRRVELIVPLFVYGYSSDHQPFHEEAYTLNLNEGGCLVSLAAEVVPGQRLCLTNTENQAECECRVIHISKRVQGRLHIGVGFLPSGPLFWENVLL